MMDSTTMMDIDGTLSLTQSDQSRAFSVAGLQMLGSLPHEIRSIESLELFNSTQKIILSINAFD